MLAPDDGGVPPPASRSASPASVPEMALAAALDASSSSSARGADSCSEDDGVCAALGLGVHWCLFWRFVKLRLHKTSLAGTLACGGYGTLARSAPVYFSSLATTKT